MKRLLSLFFLCLMCIGNVLADTWTDNNGVTWTYSIKTFTNAKGESVTGASLIDMKGNSNIIIVPESVGEKNYPVLAIGAESYGSKSPFSNQTNITKVLLPSGLIIIGYQAFNECKGITSIDIPEGVTFIGTRAFASCDLKSITIPHNVEEIDTQAFANNFNLSSIKVLSIKAPYSDVSYNFEYPFLFCGTNEIHVYKTATGYDEGYWADYIIKKDIPITLATGISLSSSSECLSMGDTLSLAATLSPSNATIHDVVWSCSNSKVIKSLGNGKFKAVADGFAYVRGTTADGGTLTARCRITVGNGEFVDVSTITLDEKEITMRRGEYWSLNATLSPNNASFKSVVWSSSNEKIATVDENGEVTALAKGTATITATSEDNDKVKATCSVSVLAPYTKSLKMSQTDVYMDTFETLRLTASPTPSDAEPKVKWSSDNEQVVKVSSNGTLTPTGEGFAVITAKATDGSNASAAASVTVKHAPYNPHLSAKKTGYSYTSWTGYSINFELKNNGSETINVTHVAVKDPVTHETLSTTTDASLLGTLKPGGTKGLSYKASADIDIATEWEYTYKGETYTFCSWKTYPIVVEAIALNKTSLNLALGETAQLTTTVSPKGAKSEVEWESSNTQVVTVGTDGNVRTVGPGKATITATSTDGTHRKATCEVTVTKYDVTKLALKESSCNLEIGSSITLEPTITPANAYNKNLVWTSSNEDVAMVNSSGKVVGIAEGEAVITVASEEHPEVTASVTVKVIPVYVKNIELNRAEQRMHIGESVQLTATVSPSNAKDSRVNWDSSNEDVAMVSTNGKVVALALGECEITATANDGQGAKATCRIKVTEVEVTSLTLNASEKELVVGDSFELIADVQPNNAHNKVLAWSSSDTKVLTVSSEGVVSALKAGKAVVSVKTTDGTELSTSCTITVKNALAETIALSESQLDMNIGEAYWITASLTPQSANNQQLKWTSSNENTVKVSQQGELTAVAEGEADVMVQTTDGTNLSAVCHVIVHDVAKEENEHLFSYFQNRQKELEAAQNDLQILALSTQYSLEIYIANSSDDNLRYEIYDLVHQWHLAIQVVQSYLAEMHSMILAYHAEMSLAKNYDECRSKYHNIETEINSIRQEIIKKHMEIDPNYDGMSNLVVDGKSKQFFTTDGRRINEMQNGVNIIRTEDGKTIKVLKK